MNFLEKTLKLNPKDSEASVVFAKIMAKESHFNEAEKIMIDAIKQNPYDANLHYTIAQFYKESGQHENYIAELKEALNNADTLAFAARLLENEIKLAQQN